MPVFNNGKAYHGEAVTGGKLRGTTDTDYFYFFCPKCPDDEILRILEYGIHHEEPTNPYDAQLRSKAKNGFTLVFKIHCESCKLTDFVKISNVGWQSGKYREVLGHSGRTE